MSTRAEAVAKWAEIEAAAELSRRARPLSIAVIDAMRCLALKSEKRTILAVSSGHDALPFIEYLNSMVSPIDLMFLGCKVVVDRQLSHNVWELRL